MMRRKADWGLATLALLVISSLGAPVLAQDVSGQVYEDRNGNGQRDAGEPALSNVNVRLFGTAGGSGIDQSALTDSNGAYAFSPGTGCYLVAPTDPAGWRLSQQREDSFPDNTPGYTFPVGVSRYSKIDQGIDNLQAGGNYTYASVGDSIAWNFNFCGYQNSFWYSQQVRNRLSCVAPGTSVTLNEAAVKGEHTDDLLVDDNSDTNNVFRLLDLRPNLVTISMIGNDLLDVDPGSNASQSQVNTAVAEVLDARQNMQEVMSTLLSEIPDLDIALNTLYDNEAYNCYSGAPGNFHRTWIPIVSRILRDLAWGQSRRVAVNEVAAEFAREDQNSTCTGYDGMICRDFFSFDDIHPTNDGYEIVREKVWEGIGGVSLGSDDVLNRTTIDTVDHGYLRLVRRLSPTSFEVLNGASIGNAPGALAGDDGDNAAGISLGAGSEEVRFSGFPDWYDEIQIVRVVAGVRYKTTGIVGDDFYRIEASRNSTFRPPPGFNYQPTQWNFFTPIVGGGGPNAPAENPDYGSAKVLGTPSVSSFATKSALLTQDPILPGGSADYIWPALTHEDISTATIRVASAPVAGTAGNDAYQIDLDHTWLDLYGWEKARPAEVAGLRLDRTPDGATIELAFDELAGATRYNVYTGSLQSLVGGSYNHGNVAAECAAPTAVAEVGRLKVARATTAQAANSVYYLITGHVDDVESPSGFSTGGTEIDRSQSVCR